MMRIYNKLLMTVALMSLFIVNVKGQGFVPKDPYSFERIRSASDYEKYVNFSSLFEFPSEISKKSDITKNPEIQINITETNPDILKFKKYYFSKYSGVSVVAVIPAGAFDKGKLEVEIIYKGISAKNYINTNVIPMQLKNDIKDLAPGDTVVMNILKNDSPSKYLREGKLEIVGNAKYGTLEIQKDNSIKYTNKVGTPNYSFEKFAYKVTDLAGNIGTAEVKLNIHENPYVSRVFEYIPASGQFVNTSLGNSEAGKKIIGKGGLVTLGGWGGYIIAGFDQPIVNRENNAYGVDFTVSGNAFGGWGEPAAVQVMKDENHNGLPDDTWYELAGSEYYFQSTKKNVEMTYYNPKYTQRHDIVYSTNIGKNGVLRTNNYHKQPYFPDPFDFGISKDKHTYKGNWTNFMLDKSNPGRITAKRIPIFGYADSKPNNRYPTNPLNPYFKDENGNSADGFDISWAVDSKGNHVDLDTIHFVKVYNTTQEDGGWLGEVSPEVTQIAITTPDPEYKPKDYEFNVIGAGKMQIIKGETFQYEGILFKNGIPQNATVEWASSVSSIGTVDNKGNFKALNTGKTTLTFSTKEGIAPATIDVEVVELVSMELKGNITTFYKNEKGYFHAEAIDNRKAPSNHYAYEKYTWSIEDSDIGTIEDGIFTALSIGKTKIKATSKTNKSISAEIEVEVKEAPEVTKKTNVLEIKLPENQKQFAASDIFEVEGGGQIFIELSEKVNNAYVEAKIEKGKLDIKFPKAKPAQANIKLKTIAYGKQKEFDITVKLIKEAKVLLNIPKRIVFVNGGKFGIKKGNVKYYDPVEKETVKIADFEKATSVQDLKIYDQYVYVSADYNILKYDLNTNKLIAQRYTQDVSKTEADGKGKEGYGVNHKMEVYKDKYLLATRQNSSAAPEDGYNVRIYDMDLNLVKKVAISDQASDVVIVDDKAYILINGGFAGTKGKIAVVNLETLTFEKEIDLGVDGKSIMHARVHNKEILIMSGGTEGKLIVFNTEDETHEVKAGINIGHKDYSSAPLSVGIVDNNLIVKTHEDNNGALNVRLSQIRLSDYSFKNKDFTRFNTGRIIDGVTYLFMGSAYDKEDEKYYFTYGQWHGDGVGLIYNKNGYKRGTFEGVEDSPEAMEIFYGKTITNDCPIFDISKKIDELPVVVENKQYIYTFDSDLFLDDDQNLTWDCAINESSNMPEGFAFDAEKRTISGIWNKEFVASFNLTISVTDTYGQKAETNVILRTQAIDDAPTVATQITDITTVESTDDLTIDLSKTFTDIDNEDSEIIINVASNSNTDMITTSIKEKYLKLSFTKYKNGEANIVISGTSNGKTVYEEFKVTLTPVDDAPTVKTKLQDLTITNSNTTVINLENIFEDIDSEITLSVETDKEDILEAVIDDNKLKLKALVNKGEVNVKVKASSKGKEAETSFKVNVDISVGIEEREELTSTKIYPNPFEDNITIDCNTNKTIVEILNSNGIVIYKSVRNTTHNLNLNHLSSGVYFVRIISDKEVVTKKIIKK